MRHLADRARAAPAGSGTEIVLEFRRDHRVAALRQPAGERRPAAGLG